MSNISQDWESKSTEEILEGIRSQPVKWLIQTQSTGSTTRSPNFFYPLQKDLVSVIIPAFNAEPFLANAIASVWRQKLPDSLDIEIIIIDDGSSDGTYELALTMAHTSPYQMHVLQHKGGVKRGVSASRTLGILEAKGEWISFLDADDAFLPEKTWLQVEWLKQHPKYVCICSYGYNIDESGSPTTGWNGTTISGDYQSIDESVRLKEPYTFKELENGCPVVNSTFLTHRKALLWSGLLSELIAHQAEDWILFAKISLKWDIPVLKQPLIKYRIHSSSWTTQYLIGGFEAGVKLEFLFEITHWLFSKPDLSEFARSYYRKNFPRYFSSLAKVSSLIDMYSIEYLPNNNAQNQDSSASYLSNDDYTKCLMLLERDLENMKTFKKYKRLLEKVRLFSVLKKFSKFF